MYLHHVTAVRPNVATPAMPTHLVELSQRLGGVAVAGHADVGIVHLGGESARAPDVLERDLLVAIVWGKAKLAISSRA